MTSGRPSKHNGRCSQRGMTLIELMLTIVVVGLCAAALYSAMASITGRSADPMLRQQSLSLAEAYLEEIALQAFSVLAQPACAQARTCFNDVRDYHGLSDFPPRNAFGAPISELVGYRVDVTVQGPNAFDGVQALRFDVAVTDPTGQKLSLTGVRTCYGEVDASGAGSCP
ncbi:prepilin-type N-terminal cleavage/methylation domain-containing protein [Stutzerimonas stutzeri]|uniref:type IV pilus modification PilV family protein n=1 Tax=Stutzerimonas stutzeri TaxID=316 RepID=UPI001ED94B05|nr:type II secretion system protein [Stutzerimonas stutzeri]